MEPSTTQDLISNYNKLHEDKQALVLCWLSYRLTVEARNAYPEAYANSVDAPTNAQALKMLRELNELQHQVIQQLGHLLNHEANRYPDDVFISSIAERGGILIRANLDEALQAAMARISE